MKILDRFMPKANGTARKQIGVSEKKDYSKMLENEKARQIYENLTKNPDAYRKGLMNQYLGIKDKDGNMIPISSNTSAKAKTGSESSKNATKGLSNSDKTRKALERMINGESDMDKLLSLINEHQANIDRNTPSWFRRQRL